MDQENQNTNTDQASSAQDPSAEASAQTSSSSSFDQLMAQSPKLSPLCGWIKCLRKPALSMQYSFQKQHIPDLDAQPGTQTPAGGGGQGKQNAAGQSSASGGTQASAVGRSGQSSDSMGISGACTIRYFDLALGALGLMMLGCLLKGCCCLKRKMY